MDINILYTAIIAAVAGLISGWGTALKTAAPRIIETRIKEREAQVMEAAERAAYERNRKATQEDRTFEMLHDTLEFIQERAVEEYQYRKEQIAREDDFRERQLEMNARVVETLTELGFKYHTLAGNQSITNQHLAVMTDGINAIRLELTNGR